LTQRALADAVLTVQADSPTESFENGTAGIGKHVEDLMFDIHNFCSLIADKSSLPCG